VITAASAKRKTVREAASFTKLSPSKMVSPRRGMFTPLSTEVAATASGGEMMPPSKKPSAKVKPGMIFAEKYAIANEVKNTSPKPIKKTERRHRQKLFQDVYQAASKSSGGKKIRNIKSGSTVMLGIPGMKLMP